MHSPIKSSPIKNSMSLSLEDCLSLAQSGKGLPLECESLLEKAGKTGLLTRRHSRRDHWSIAEGHGVRRFYHPKDGTDSLEGPNHKTVDEIYLNNKSEAYKSKVQRLRTRMSVRGARGVSGINEAEVQSLKKAELLKKKSRREDLKHATF